MTQGKNICAVAATAIERRATANYWYANFLSLPSRFHIRRSCGNKLIQMHSWISQVPRPSDSRFPCAACWERDLYVGIHGYLANHMQITQGFSFNFDRLPII